MSTPLSRHEQARAAVTSVVNDLIVHDTPLGRTSLDTALSALREAILELAQTGLNPNEAVIEKSGVMVLASTITGAMVLSPTEGTYAQGWRVLIERATGDTSLQCDGAIQAQDLFAMVVAKVARYQGGVCHG